MSKKLLVALILIGLTVLILIANARGSANIHLGFLQMKHVNKALAFLSFTGMGVVIGTLLK